MKSAVVLVDELYIFADSSREGLWIEMNYQEFSEILGMDSSRGGCWIQVVKTCE